MSPYNKYKYTIIKWDVGWILEIRNSTDGIFIDDFLVSCDGVEM